MNNQYEPDLNDLMRHAIIAQVREERGESLAEFACTLAGLMGARRNGCFAPSYVSKLCNAKTPITAEVWKAVSHLLEVQEQTRALLLRTRINEVTVTVRTMHALPKDTLVLAMSHRCAWPACQVEFIPEWPMQAYCPIHRQDAEHARRERYNEKRRARRAARRQL
jgi:hypothetical protein